MRLNSLIESTGSYSFSMWSINCFAPSKKNMNFMYCMTRYVMSAGHVTGKIMSQMHLQN